MIKNPQLEPHTQIEVIRIHKITNETVKKVMTYENFKGMNKQTGYTYTAYQLNFSQFLTSEPVKQ